MLVALCGGGDHRPAVWPGAGAARRDWWTRWHWQSKCQRRWFEETRCLVCLVATWPHLVRAPQGDATATLLGTCGARQGPQFGRGCGARRRRSKFAWGVLPQAAGGLGLVAAGRLAALRPMQRAFGQRRRPAPTISPSGLPGRQALWRPAMMASSPENWRPAPAEALARTTPRWVQRRRPARTIRCNRSALQNGKRKRKKT